MEPSRWEALIRALMIPVQDQPDPMKCVNLVLKDVVAAKVLDGDLHTYREALQAALATEVLLSGLVPQDHSEATIRAFLKEVERRLGEIAAKT